MERQIQVLVFTADVRVQVPPRPPKEKAHPSGCAFSFGNQVPPHQFSANIGSTIRKEEPHAEKRIAVPDFRL